MKPSKALVILIGASLTIVIGVPLLQQHLAQNRIDLDSNSVLSGQESIVASPALSNVDRFTSSEERKAESGLGFDAEGLEFERKLVKNAPFSATLTIETLESKADGSVLTRTATSRIYRDEEGRTRRDRMPDSSASAVPNTDQQPQSTTINDPVAGFTYTLDHRAQLARRSTLRALPEPDANEQKIVTGSIAPTRDQTARNQILPMPNVGGSGHGIRNATSGTSFAGPKNTPLGEREIEGISAEGTRVSVRIPLGAMGNNHAMEIVVERWYSSELNTTVLATRTDPRFGEIVYRLTNIERGKPAATLFIVPQEYKITGQTDSQESFRRD